MITKTTTREGDIKLYKKSQYLIINLGHEHLNLRECIRILLFFFVYFLLTFVFLFLLFFIDFVFLFCLIFFTILIKFYK